MTARPNSQRRATPLICPKGYGLCYGCETWCDGKCRHNANQGECPICYREQQAYMDLNSRKLKP